MNTKIIIAIIIVLVGGGAFYGGVQYQKSAASKALQGLQSLTLQQRQQRLQQLGFGGFAGRNGGNGQGNGIASGQIIAKDDKSITVQLRNNSGSKIVILPGSAEILKSDAGTATDLAIGQNVLVNGTGNADGSITAQTVQIRPAQPAGNPSAPTGQ